jgi:hypothetical protein
VAPAIFASRLAPSPLRRRWVRRRSGLPATGRIFGLGLTRTGTSSLTRALELLGYRSLHYPQDDRTRHEVKAFLAGGDDRLRLSVLEKYDALTDTPICATFEGLDAAYPGSKFVLTAREKESWLASCQRFFRDSLLDSWLLANPDNPRLDYIRSIHWKIYGTPTFDREQFSRAYDDYHERVRRHFRDRPEDLLTIDICAGEGWEPLCEFLALPHPGTQFPYVDPTPFTAGSPATSSQFRAPRAD